MHKNLTYKTIVQNALVCIGAFLCFSTFAQEKKPKKIEILNANAGKFDKAYNQNAQRLVGDVRLKHDSVLMFCDSAIIYKNTNKLEAYGHVFINQGDTLTLTGKRLDYNGNTKKGKVFGDVDLNDPQINLKTSVVDYDGNNSVVYYPTFGTITSKTNSNKLTSNKGSYFSESKIFHFKDSVRLYNEKNTVQTDTMHYNTQTEIAYFFGPTTILSDSGKIYCEDGWYNSKSLISEFRKNARVDNKSQIIKGDTLFYDQDNALGIAKGNMSIEDTTNKVIVYGDVGYFFEREDSALIPQNPLLVQILEDDSLFLSADSVFLGSDTAGKRIMWAYNKVRFFKSDFQGVCDTLVYNEATNTISLYHAPVLWSDKNQITGTVIELLLDSNKLKEIHIPKDAFIAEKVDSIRYNQVKGKKLTGYIENGELKTILIEGNGESIYHAQETKTDSNKVVVEVKNLGINKAVCSNIKVVLKDNTLDQIFFLTKPDGGFYPTKKFNWEESTLKNFSWQDVLRPKNKDEVRPKAKSVTSFQDLPVEIQVKE